MATRKICPDKQGRKRELNPKTNNCVYICEEGKIRDENFICVSKTIKKRNPCKKIKIIDSKIKELTNEKKII